MTSTIGGRARSAWRAIQRSASSTPAAGIAPSPASRATAASPRAHDAHGPGPGRRGRSTARPRKRCEHARRVLVGEQAEDEVERAGRRGHGRGNDRRPRARRPDCGRRRARARPRPAAGRAAARARAAAAAPAIPPSPSPRAAPPRATSSALLVAQHRHRERGVHRLVGAGQARAAADRGCRARRDNGACRRDLGVPGAARAAARARPPPAAASRDPRAPARPDRAG